jgi:sugar lactone lactonase YvrE
MTDHKVSPFTGHSLCANPGALENASKHTDFFARITFDSLSVFRRFITICAFVLISFGLLPCSIAADSTLGDIDGDGVVSVLDIVRLNNHAAKKASLGENQKILADVDQDGVINDADRDLLVQEILETRDPANLPLAKVRETSPSSGESDVAVSRETILYFTIPLHESSTIDTTKLTAKFGDRKLLTRAALSSDRRKATLFYLEPIPASATITVSLDSTGLKDLINRPIDADGDGVAGGVFTTSFSTLGITALPSTGVVGRVIASEKGSAGEDIPIEGAIITVDGKEETLRAVTDANGNFTLSPAPGGSFFVHIDGRQAPIVGQDMTKPITDRDYYPYVGKKWYAEAGNSQNKSGDIDDTPNQGGGTGVIYLPLVKAGSLKTVSSTQTTEITAPPLDDPALNEMMQGVKLEVPPGSLFSDDGTSGGSVGIAPVAPDRLPSPLPEGLDLPLVITVQTDGPTNFERPVPVTFPNLPDPQTGEKLAPGEKSALWSFNHDTGKWEIVGPMTVSEDGNFVSTDAGVGLLQPGWHGTRPGAWGEGKVCHACSKQVGEAWSEASGLAYGIALNAIKLNNMYLDEVDNVMGNAHHFDSIQFKGANQAPAGLTATQVDSLLDYVGHNQDAWWSQFSIVTASLGTPELIAEAIKQLEKLTQGNPGNVDWWPAVEGLVEFKPIQGKIVALDLPIRMTLLAWASFAESDEIDAAHDDWKELKIKQKNLIGLIKGCLKSDQRKNEAGDIAGKNQDLQTALVAQIETELSAWGELLDKTPDLELRTSISNTTPSSAPDPLPSIGKTKDKAKQWLAYLQKVRSLLLLLQKKDQSLIEDFEDLIVLMDQYFTDLNQYVVDCEEKDDHGKEKAKPIKDIYIRLQSPALDERFLSTSGFIARVLAARTPYLLSVYSVKTQTIGSVFFLSPATGSSRQIPTVPMYSDKGGDEDKDGLSDQAEGVLGTDPVAGDSDGDGMNDKAELQNGTDPMISNTGNGTSKPVRTGIIGTLPVFNGVSAVDVDVDDNTMAVALGTAGIGIYDVTVATAPVRIKEYKVGGDVVSVAVGRDYAVGAAGSRGMAIVPLSVNSENPLESVIVKLKSPVNAVTTDGSLAYAGLENGDVVVVDIASGLEITRMETDLGAIEDIDYGAGQIIARGRSSMKILSLGDEGLVKTGETSSSNWVSWTGRLRLTYVNDEIIATNLSGFQSFDISNPQSPVLKGSYTDGQLGWKHMAATGSGLGVAVNSQFSGSQGDVRVYDFRYAFGSTQAERDKAFLGLEIPTPGDAMAVSIYNGFAFVADSSSGVQVINFMPYDFKGVMPTIQLESNFNLTPDPTTGKVKIDEGKRMLLKAIVSDDVMVRNVELYINGEKFATDGNYPFEFTEITPLRSVMTEFKLKARAYDTGGNYEETDEITLELFPDSVPPRVVKNFPANDDLIAPLDKVWVRFSEPMDELSLGGTEDAQGAVRILSAGADKVLGNGDDVQIPFIGSFNTDTDIYTLSFEAQLEPGLYQFVVENTAKDLAGNALTNPMTDVEFRVYSDEDSDEDGIPDDWEAKLGYEPLNAYSRWLKNGGSLENESKIEDGEYDTDNDGLSDAGEIVMETALDKNDSDGDGILDGNEDADLDGLRDGMEIRYATDPFDVDTDGDELDDNSEIADGTNPNRANNMPITIVSGVVSYIVDAQSPVITLLGNNPLTLFKGGVFQDPGAKVTDDVDFEKTVLGNGTVNSSVLGNYTITYSATDRSGKVATPVLRTVSVTLNPAGDEDADGLTNGQEEALGTNPEIADTDADGSSDKEEVWSGSDPKDSTSIPDSGLLSVSPTNLANFYSVFGYPSAEKSFTITTSDKVKGYVVEAPVGFEVSQNGHDFSQALTILPGNQGAVLKVVSNGRAYAALKADGSVATWGDEMSGGNSTRVADKLASGVVEVVGAESWSGAFAAIKGNGSVVTWGSDMSGGNSTAVANQIASGVVKVFTNGSSFAALKANGSVVTWGDSMNGGSSTAVASQLASGVEEVFPIQSSSSGAFVAVKSNGALVSWGNDSVYNNGTTTTIANWIGSGGIKKIVAANGAWAALKDNGNVVVWGTSHAADVFNADLTNIIDVVPGDSGFAAIKTSGAVISWGMPAWNLSQETLNKLQSDVERVLVVGDLFAARKIDGSIVWWGGGAFWDSLSQEIKSQLQSGVKEIRSGVMGVYAALKDDGSVVTWGSSGQSLFSSSPSVTPAPYNVSADSPNPAPVPSPVAGGGGGAGNSSGPSLQSQLASGVVKLYSNANALSALKEDGSVVVWAGGASGANALPAGASTQLAAGVKEIIPSSGAFAALKKDGSVVTWGEEMSGGNSYQAAGRLTTGVEKVYFGSSVYALKGDGSVASWSNSMVYSANMAAVVDQLASGVKNLYFSGSGPTGAVAALKLDGSVVTWGDEWSGGNSTSVASELASGVVEIFPAGSGFIALKSNGSVVTWGGYGMGAGNSSSVASQLSAGVVKIVTNGSSGISAAAALKNDGSVVTWGDSMSGGDSSAVASGLSSGVVEIYANSGAFIALKANGSVVTWGNEMTGGNSTAVASQIASGIVDIFTNGSAVAALKSNGSVVTWGGEMSGGNSFAVASQIASGVEEIFSNSRSGMGSFAALKSNGSVVTWGDQMSGGDSSAVASQLASDVVDVISNGSAYAALKSDGSVVAWGNQMGGGDPSYSIYGQPSVADELTSGVVEVLAAPGRFIALKEGGSSVTWGDGMTTGNYGWASLSDPLYAGLPWVADWARGFEKNQASDDQESIATQIWVRINDNVPVGSISGSISLRMNGIAKPSLSLSGVVLDASADQDGDGLINGGEGANGTDPYKQDTDGDGYSDKEEVEADTDPLDVDDKPGIEYSEGTVFGGSYAWAQGVDVAVQMPMLDDGGHWIIVSGSLPKGLILGHDSRITGVPTEAGVTDVVMGYEANTGTSETRLRIRIIPTTASGGGYTFSNLAGALWGYFSGSADASGAYTGSSDGFSGSNDSFNGSGDGGFVGSGDGMGGWIGNKDGVGSEAMFHRPGGVAVGIDGTIYVSDSGNNAIRQIDANGQVTKLAGNFFGSADGNFLGSSDGVFSGSSDGVREDAGLKNPQGLSVDKDWNVIVADRKNHAIRKVSPDGVVTTVAGSFTGSGTGGLTGSSDGSASGARFNHPSDVVVDGAGNIYVADSGNHAIRKIDLSGNVTTLAGDLGYSGYQDGTADSAMFNSPQGIAIDAAGNIIVADTTNGLIRKVTPGGVVTTIAGSLFTNNAGAAFQGSGGEAFTGSSGEGGRSGWSDKAYAYFTGSLDGFTGSGDGFTGSADGGFTGSADLGWPESLDGTGFSASFSFPTDVEIDSSGNIFVVDSGSSSIRKITPSGVVTTIGNVPEGFFYFPQGIAVDANGRLIVADSGNNRIARSNEPDATPTPTPTPGGASQ